MMKEQIFELVESKKLNEAQICEGFLNILIANKSFLSKNDRIMHLADVILNDAIFE